MSRLKGGMLLIGVLALAVGAFLDEGQTPQSGVKKTFASAEVETVPRPPQAVKTASKAQLEQWWQQAEAIDVDAVRQMTLPASLRDTPPPQPPRMDADGQLIVDAGLRRFFEFYLTAIGEEPLPTILARIQADLNHYLDDEAEMRALDLLANYIDYRNQIGEIKNQFLHSVGDTPWTLDLVASMKQHLRDARQTFFEDAVVVAFFADEDAFDDYMIARQRLLTDTSLNEVQRQALLSDLQQTTPDWILRSEGQSNQLNRLRAETAALGQTPAAANQIQQHRQQTLGIEAAEKLAELDQQRAHWQARVDYYRQEFNQLPKESRDETSLAALRAAHFSGAELVRIKALDTIDGLL